MPCCASRANLERVKTTMLSVTGVAQAGSGLGARRSFSRGMGGGLFCSARSGDSPGAAGAGDSSSGGNGCGACPTSTKHMRQLAATDNFSW